MKKSPSFKALYNRDPIPYKDFNPHYDLCQDDYKFYTGIGNYTDNPTEEEKTEDNNQQ